MNGESKKNHLLEVAEEYLEMVRLELAKREKRMVLLQQEINVLEEKNRQLQPEQFLRIGKPMLIRSLAESRKEVADQIEILSKQVPDLEKDILSARERLVIAQQECEELRED